MPKVIDVRFGNHVEVRSVEIDGSKHYILHQSKLMKNATDVAIEQNDLPVGHCEDLHLHENAWDEVTIINGSCILVTASETPEIEMEAGDVVTIEARTLHAFRTNGTHARLQGIRISVE